MSQPFDLPSPPTIIITIIVISTCPTTQPTPHQQCKSFVLITVTLCPCPALPAFPVIMRSRALFQIKVLEREDWRGGVCGVLRVYCSRTADGAEMGGLKREGGRERRREGLMSSMVGWRIRARLVSADFQRVQCAMDTHTQGQTVSLQMFPKALCIRLQPSTSHVRVQSVRLYHGLLSPRTSCP